MSIVGGDDIGWTCFICDRGIGMDGRKIITVRILGELQWVGVCGIFLEQHPNHELWKKIEEVEHIFFLKRLSNPYYNWADYWNDVYYERLIE